MVSVFMLSRSRLAVALTVLAGPGLLTLACQRVPLLAPSGSTIVLTATATTLSFGATTRIVAQVLEPAGTPPHDGTHVIFTTTLGTIQPSEAQTDVNGQAIAIFNAGAASGTAMITAASGGATVATNGALKILVGTAAVGKVVVNANPALVPSLGGSSTITAHVIDVNGNALADGAGVIHNDRGRVEHDPGDHRPVRIRSHHPHNLDSSDGDGKRRRGRFDVHDAAGHGRRHRRQRPRHRARPRAP